MPRKIIIMGLLLIMAFKPVRAFADDKVVLNIGVLPIIESLAVAICETQPEITQSNISIHFEVFSTWTALEAAYRTGIVDIAAMTAPKTLKMASNNIPVKILLGLHRNGNMLVTNFDLNSPDKFKGTMIGVSGNDTGQLLLLSQYLKKHDIALGAEVRYIAIPQSKAVELLRIGKIQGFLLSEPYGTMAQAEEGLVKSAVPGVEISENFVDVLLIATPTILKSNPKEIKILVDAIKKSGLMIEKDVKTSQGKQVSFLQSDVSGIVPAIVQKALCNPASKLKFDDMQINVDELKEIEKQALSLGILDSGVDFNNIVDTQFSR
jgi:ABC-type nitrate/sulfonate/bicarbonate transport system substrate-binding protein